MIGQFHTIRPQKNPHQRQLLANFSINNLPSQFNKLPQYFQQQPSSTEQINYEIYKVKSRSCAHKHNSKSRSHSKYNGVGEFKETYNKNEVPGKYHSRQIREEYNLQEKLKSHSKKCHYELHNCKNIENYLLRIKNELNSQKQKNKLLKRRNLQLTKQNQVFNQYFQVFEPKYQELIIKCQNRKNEADCHEQRNGRKVKSSKSEKKLVLVDKVSESREHTNGNTSYSKLTLKTADPTKSFMTSKSSRNKEKQMRINSRMEEFYSRCS